MSDPVRKGGGVRWVPPEEWKPAAVEAWRRAHPWRARWQDFCVIIRRLIGGTR